MKNIYFLIPTVLFIWGFIGYKIVKTINPSGEMVITENNLVEFIPDKIKEVEKFTIKADYRDPFLGKLTTKKAPKKTSNQSVKRREPEVVFPDMVYNGIITPKETGRSVVYFVSINKIQYLLSIGKQVEGVKLLKGSSKEITVRFQNKNKTFSIQQ